MSEDLRRCPMCGNPLEIAHRNGSKYVRCITCIFETARHGDHVSDDELKRRCNRRPAEDALKAEVERLKVELDAQKSVSKIAHNDIEWLCKQVEKWKKMFYDLDDKQAKVSTEINDTITAPKKGGEDE